MVGMEAGHGGHWLILPVVPPAQLQLVSIRGLQPSPGGTEPSSLLQSPSPFSSVFSRCFFSISTVKRVSPLPLPAAGVSWEGRGGTGLNRSHINSPRLTAPPWAPRGEQAIVPGSLHPPSRLLPASLACSLPAPCIPLPTSCLFPAFSPHPVQPHPMGMSLFPTLPGAAM